MCLQQRVGCTDQRVCRCQQSVAWRRISAKVQQRLAAFSTRPKKVAHARQLSGCPIQLPSEAVHGVRHRAQKGRRKFRPARFETDIGTGTDAMTGMRIQDGDSRFSPACSCRRFPLCHLGYRPYWRYGDTQYSFQTGECPLLCVRAGCWPAYARGTRNRCSGCSHCLHGKSHKRRCGLGQAQSICHAQKWLVSTSAGCGTGHSCR